MINYNLPDETNGTVPDKPQKLSEFQIKRAARIASHAERLYDILPEVCWKTEQTMAKELGISRREVRLAKDYLLTHGQIRIELDVNGRRNNPKHIIRKLNPIIPMDVDRAPSWEIDWSLFEDFAAKDFNNWPIVDQVEIYHEMGLKAIPLHFPKFKRGIVYCSCPLGRNCHSIGKHPIIQFKEIDFSYSRTLNALRAYWRDKDSRFNVGFVIDGFSVVDIDRRHGGHHSFDELQEAVGELPIGLSVTSGDGRHIYVNDFGSLNSTDEVLGLPGLQIKARGGVIVAPPSMHKWNRQYQWEITGTPEPLPKSWSIALFEGSGEAWAIRRTERRTTLPAKLDSSFVIPEGLRNDTLFKFACRERAKGADGKEILRRLERINLQNCKPPLSIFELHHIAKSAAKYPTEASKYSK